MFKTAALATSLALAACPAFAADGDSVEVRIDDLDLATTAGQHQLDRRVERAARRICANGARDLVALAAENDCIALAIGSAAPQAERAIALARSNRRMAQTGIAVSG